MMAPSPQTQKAKEQMGEGKRGIVWSISHALGLSEKKGLHQLCTSHEAALLGLAKLLFHSLIVQMALYIVSNHLYIRLSFCKHTRVLLLNRPIANGIVGDKESSHTGN
jgi:hypothetical protein